MSQSSFQVNITPSQALSLVQDGMNADLIHEEFHDVGGGRSIGTLVFEKYYMRTSNRAALVVIIDDLKGVTEVRSIATGSSQGMFFNFDWGASDDFVHQVEEVLEEYIVE